MYNVFGYIDEQSDSSFSERPVCEVDALVFAWLSYFEIEKLDDLGIACIGLTLKELAEEAERNLGKFRKPSKREKLISTVTGAWMLKQVSDKPRFSGVGIGGFRTVTDHVNGIQFSATSYILETGMTIVAYRGTDTSLAGWKEDCEMSYNRLVPSQELALHFLNECDSPGTIMLAGHSKGGNLAIYAASECRSEIVPMISEIYNFDGPGFSFDIGSTANYNALKDRIHSYVPGSSVFGMLLDHVDDYAVVSSMNAGLMQHYAFYWKIEGCSFILQKKRNLSSRSMDAAFNQWLGSLSLEDRKEITEAIFSVFEKAGVKYFNDFSSISFARIKEVFSEVHNMDPQTKKMIRSFFGKLMRASKNEMISSAKGFFGKVRKRVVNKVQGIRPFHKHGGANEFVRKGRK